MCKPSEFYPVLINKEWGTYSNLFDLTRPVPYFETQRENNSGSVCSGRLTMAMPGEMKKLPSGVELRQWRIETNKSTILNSQEMEE